MIGLIELSKIVDEYGIRPTVYRAVSFFKDAPEGCIEDIIEAHSLHIILKKISLCIENNRLHLDNEVTLKICGGAVIKNFRKTLAAQKKQVQPLLDETFPDIKETK